MPFSWSLSELHKNNNNYYYCVFVMVLNVKFSGVLWRPLVVIPLIAGNFTAFSKLFIHIIKKGGKNNDETHLK